MNRNQFFCLLLLLNTWRTEAQHLPTGLIRFYDTTGLRIAKIQPCTNGDFLLLINREGTISSALPATALVTRTDAQLQIQWIKRLPGASLFDIIESESGALYTTGLQFVGNDLQRQIVCKLTAQGTPVWAVQTPPGFNYFPQNLLFPTVQRAPGTPHLLVSTYAGNASQTELRCLDTNGISVWNRLLVFPGQSNQAFLRGWNGELLLLSQTAQPPYRSQVHVLDATANYLYTRVLPDSARAYRLAADTATHTYLVGGNYLGPLQDFRRQFIARLPGNLASSGDMNGIVWLRGNRRCGDAVMTLGVDQRSNAYAFELLPQFNGSNSLYVPDSSYSQMAVLKLDSSLQPTWHRQYIMPNRASTSVLGALNFWAGEDRIIAPYSVPERLPSFGAFPADTVRRGVMLQVTDSSGAMANCVDWQQPIIHRSIQGTTSLQSLPPQNLAANPFQPLTLTWSGQSGLMRSDTCIIRRRPRSGFQFTSNAGVNVVCAGAPANLLNLSLFEPQQYQWIFPPGVDLSSADSSCFPSLNNVRFTQPGVYPVQLVALNGAGSDTFTRFVQVLVNDLFPPNLGPDTTICAGDSVRLTYSGGPTSTHYFQQITGGSFFSTSDTVILRNPGTYVLVASSPCGSAADTIQVTVRPRPDADFTYRAACGELRVRFSDSSAYSGPGTLQYGWSFFNDQGQLLGTSDAWNPEFVFPVIDTVRVRLIVQAPGPCSLRDTVEKWILLRARPQAAFSFTDTCGSTQVNFLSTSAITSGSITQYAWSFGDGNSSNLADPVHHFSGFASYPVRLIVTSSEDCRDTLTQPVRVRARPQAGIATVGQRCAGPVLLQDSSGATGALISAWGWRVEPGGLDYNTPDIQPTLPAGTITVRHWVTSDAGCPSDTLVRSLLIEAPPLLTLPDTLFGCAGQNLLPLAQITSGSPVVAWNWTTSSGLASSAPDPQFAFPAGSHWVALQVRTEGGCTSNRDTTRMFIDPQPVPSFTVPPVCAGQPFSLINTTPDGNLFTYLWRVPGMGAGISSTNLTHIFTNEGNYPARLEARSANGCTAVTERVVRVERLRLQLTASATDTYTGDAVLLNTSANLPYEIIQWNPAGLFAQPSLRQQRFLADTTRAFQVIARSANGCLDTATLTVRVQPLNDVFVPSAFTPNGDGRNDRLRVFAGGVAEYRMEVFNRWGQSVFLSTDPWREWDGTLAGKEQPTGVFVYRLRIRKTDGRLVERTGTVTLIR